MRKASYVLTLLAVLPLLIFNILSCRLPDWLVATYDPSPDSHVVVRFGLNERCERVTVFTPEPDHDSDPVVEVLECRPFPFGVRDGCKHPGTLVCAAWTSAQYFSELGCWCAGAALVALLFGVSTHSRRQRVWRAVAGLVLMHACWQLLTFMLIAELYRTGRFPAFEHARPGSGFVLNVVSWLIGFAVAYGVFYTGIAADRGYRWAAGNRHYYPIRC